MPKALSALRTAAKQYADHDQVTGPVSDTVWNAFINDAYRELWHHVLLACGDHFLTSTDFTIATAGATQAVPAYFLQAAGLDRNPTSNYPETVPPFEFGERNTKHFRAYQIRGGVIKIEPKPLSEGDYRLWYAKGPTVLTLDADEISAEVDTFHDFIEMRAAMAGLEKQEANADWLDAILYGDGRRKKGYVEGRIMPMGRLVQGAAPRKGTDTRMVRRGNHFPHWNR